MGSTHSWGGRILDRVFGAQTAIAETQYLGLSTTPPNPDGTGATEPVGNGYARQTIAPGTFWTPGASTVTSAQLVSFQATGGAWGTVTHVGAWDAPTGGNLRWYATLADPEPIFDGDGSSFPIGDIVLGFDNAVASDALVTAVVSAVAATPYVPATNHAVALLLAAPNPDGTGIVEPVGQGYGRVVVTNNATTWPATVAGVKSNGVPVGWSTATGSWGTLTHWAVFDNLGPVLLAWGALSAPLAVTTGDTVKFQPSNLSLTVT